VSATYNLEGAKVPFFSGTVVTVYNYANKDNVNGENQNAGNTTLCARASDKDDSSKLSVAPCFLPNFLAGPYWALEIGHNAERPYEYDWAIVIGGEPTVQYDDGCSTTESGINGAGLWLFTRERVASAELIDKMRSKLTEKGIAVSRLHDVAHAGCLYKGAFLKQ